VDAHVEEHARLALADNRDVECAQVRDSIVDDDGAELRRVEAGEEVRDGGFA
jgi:hypothetical protein